MARINRSQILREISSVAKTNKFAPSLDTIGRILRAYYEVLNEHIKSGDIIVTPQGRFYTTPEGKEHSGFNSKTGEKYLTTMRKTKFKVSSRFKAHWRQFEKRRPMPNGMENSKDIYRDGKGHVVYAIEKGKKQEDDTKVGD